MQTVPDGLCMARAILEQVVHHPHAYGPEMAMRQVGLHLIRHPYKFYPLVEQELLETGESYESFCWNVYNSFLWGDDLIASAFSHMWNIRISIVSPRFRNELKLFHNSDNPDVVLVANGGAWMSDDRPSTHFSGSKSIDKTFTLAGSYLLNVIGPDQAPKLQPILLSNKEKARQVAVKDFLKQEEEKSLKLLRLVRKNIEKMDSDITDLIKESDKLRDRKQEIEYKLESLGISAEKIKEAGGIKPREYVRTREREEKDNKRKRDEKEEHRKKAKIIEVDDQGEEIVEKKGKEVVEKKEEEKVINKHIKEQQDQIERQRKIIEYQEDILKKQIAEKQEIEEKKVEKTVTKTVTGTKLVDILSPSALKFIKQETGETSTGEIAVEPTPTSTGEIAVEPTQQTGEVEPKVQSEPQFFVPTLDPKGGVVLLPTQVVKTTSLCACAQGPVDPKLQKEGRYYCNRCKANYKRKDELARHVKFNCMRQIAEFICDVCQKGYFEANTLREHFYKEHVYPTSGMYLYNCKKCNKGFHYKAHRSKHMKGSCPNSAGQDLYRGKIDLIPEYEKTFTRRIQMEIPDNVMDIADEEISDDRDCPPPPSGAVPGTSTDPVPAPQDISQEKQTAESILEAMAEDQTKSDDPQVDVKLSDDILFIENN